MARLCQWCLYYSHPWTFSLLWLEVGVGVGAIEGRDGPQRQTSRGTGSWISTVGSFTICTKKSRLWRWNCGKWPILFFLSLAWSFEMNSVFLMPYGFHSDLLLWFLKIRWFSLSPNQGIWGWGEVEGLCGLWLNVWLEIRSSNFFFLKFFSLLTPCLDLSSLYYQLSTCQNSLTSFFLTESI